LGSGAACVAPLNQKDRRLGLLSVPDGWPPLLSRSARPFLESSRRRPARAFLCRGRRARRGFDPVRARPPELGGVRPPRPLSLSLIPLRRIAALVSGAPSLKKEQDAHRAALRSAMPSRRAAPAAGASASAVLHLFGGYDFARTSVRRSSALYYSVVFPSRCLCPLTGLTGRHIVLCPRDPC